MWWESGVLYFSDCADHSEWLSLSFGDGEIFKALNHAGDKTFAEVSVLNRISSLHALLERYSWFARKVHLMIQLVDYWYSIFVDCSGFTISSQKPIKPQIFNGSQHYFFCLWMNFVNEAHSESIFTIENQSVGPTLKYFVSVWCGASGSKILILLYLRSW